MQKKTSIKIYGTSWCGGTKHAVELLNRHDIPYDFIDIDNDKAGEKFVRKVNKGYRSVPTIVFNDGSILVEPSDFELSKHLDAV